MESREDLEEEILRALDELADIQCQNVLNIDCVNRFFNSSCDNTRANFVFHERKSLETSFASI